VLREVAELVSGAARVLARDWVARAVAEAAALPLEVMEAAERQTGGAGPDPLRMAQAVGLSVVAVMRRLALRPGAATGLVVCDGSGTMVFRKPAEGFAVPRFGAACPLWPIFAALGRPGSPVVADLVTVGRGARRFRALAWCDLRHPDGLSGVELREAAMLVWPVEGAVTGGMAVQVGTSCRVCARAGCPARREPSIMGEVE
jgi:predicted transcriptional regulator